MSLIQIGAIELLGAVGVLVGFLFTTLKVVTGDAIKRHREDVQELKSAVKEIQTLVREELSTARRLVSAQELSFEKRLSRIEARLESPGAITKPSRKVPSDS